MFVSAKEKRMLGLEGPRQSSGALATPKDTNIPAPLSQFSRVEANGSVAILQWIGTGWQILTPKGIFINPWTELPFKHYHHAKKIAKDLLNGRDVVAMAKAHKRKRKPFSSTTGCDPPAVLQGTDALDRAGLIGPTEQRPAPE